MTDLGQKQPAESDFYTGFAPRRVGSYVGGSSRAISGAETTPRDASNAGQLGSGHAVGAVSG